MSYKYSELSLEEYRRDGLTIMRDLIPVTLLTDLRRESEKARAIARSMGGGQVQRCQPVYQFPEIDRRPFDDFLALDELQKAVLNILGPDHKRGENMGILLEPETEAWATHWHRDWGYNVAPMDLDAWFEWSQKLHIFNQFNAALYMDSSFWVVSGSHLRRDTPHEIAAMGKIPPDGPNLDGASADEREFICNRYNRSMPGAIPVTLLAGDCAFYRNPSWHLGTYVPYTKRATLHDGFYCDDDLAWGKYIREYQERVIKESQAVASP